MYITFSRRATSILYSFLLQNKGEGIWMIPVNVCHLIPACFIKASCPFEIIDVEAEHFLINEDQVIKRLKKNPYKYSGILTVRSFGLNSSQILFFNKLKKYIPHLKIIDDACLGYPNFDNDISEFVDLELYSTGYSKPIDLGFGGFGKLHSKKNLKSNIKLDFDKYALNEMNSHYLESCNNLRFAREEVFRSNWLINGEIDEDRYTKEVKKKLSEALSHKKRLNKIYDESINSVFKEKRLSSNWRYNIKCENPSFVIKKINEYGLFASRHYFPLNKIFGKESCPVWENMFNSILNLFNDHRFNDQKARKCSEIINQFAKPIIN